MLLAGDEFGRTQRAIITAIVRTARSPVNWEGLTENDEKLRDFTRRLIALRATQPLLRRENWRDGLEIRWFNAGGGPQQSEQWDEVPPWSCHQPS